MKAKNLVILTVIAVVLVGLAYMSSKKKGEVSGTPSVVGQHALPELQNTETLDSVEKIVCVSASSTVTVANVDGTWVAPAKYGYPVDFDKVRDFVRKLKDLKIGQPLNLTETQFTDLELDPPGTDSSVSNSPSGTLIELQDKSGTPVSSIVVGKEHTKAAPANQFGGYGGYPDGRYVAVNDKAYLVSETLADMPDNDKSWMDDDLVNVYSADVTELSVADPDGKTLTLKRPSPAKNLIIEDLGEDEEIDSSKVSSLANTLSYLSFSDVADPELAESATGLDKPTIFTARTKDGKIYTLKIGSSPEGSDDRYLKVRAAFEPPEEPEEASTKEEEKPADEGPEGDKDDADEDAAAKKKEEQEKLAKEVAELNKKTERWIYLVQSYKVDGITSDRSELVKKKEKAQEPEDDKAQTEPEKETTAAEEPAVKTEAKPSPPPAPVEAEAKPDAADAQEEKALPAVDAAE